MVFAGVLNMDREDTLFEFPDLPLDLRLAAILSLLSSSALRGLRDTSRRWNRADLSQRHRRERTEESRGNRRGRS